MQQTFKKHLLSIDSNKTTSVFISEVGSVQKEFIPCFILGLSSHYIDKLSADFFATFKVIIMDLYWTIPNANNAKEPNNFSDEFINQLSLNDMVNHYEQIRQQLNQIYPNKFNKVILFGHSAYGFLATMYSKQYPNNTEFVLNIGTPLSFNEKKLTRDQEKYLFDNFANNHPRSKLYKNPLPTNNNNKRKANTSMSENSKKIKLEREKSFYLFYTNLRPLLWRDEEYYGADSSKAQAIWNPWQIKTRRFTYAVKLNITTLEKFFELVSHHSIKLGKYITRPNSKLINFIFGIYDIRVPWEPNTPRKSHGSRYLLKAGHWPMLECSDNFDQACKEIFINLRLGDLSDKIGQNNIDIIKSYL